MHGEAKKLQLIEEILKIDNDLVLAEVETVIARNKLQVVSRQSFASFAGLLTDQEIIGMEKNIEGGCEQINTDDWK
jgi:hypothetical protein